MAKYPQHHSRSRTSAFMIYGSALVLSVVGLGVLAERFHSVVSNPAPRANAVPAARGNSTSAQRTPAKPIMPSPQVVAFVGHLKTIPGLEALWDQQPCAGLGKQPRRPRYCIYRISDIEVRVSFDRADGELRSVSFTRKYLSETPPLPWSDLASLIPWVCRDVSAAQAIATATEGAEAYSAGPWASHVGMTFERNNMEAARREIHLDPHAQCKVALVEQIDRGRNYSELYVILIKPAPERRPKTSRLSRVQERHPLEFS